MLIPKVSSTVLEFKEGNFLIGFNYSVRVLVTTVHKTKNATRQKNCGTCLFGKIILNMPIQNHPCPRLSRGSHFLARTIYSPCNEQDQAVVMETAWACVRALQREKDAKKADD